LEIASLEQMDNHGDQIRVDDRLHLILVAGSDVGQKPDSFLKQGN
jgi:hypothetical protein